MRADRLDDLVADRVVHAERTHRLLKNESDAPATNRANGLALGIERRQLLLPRCAGVEQHLARHDVARPVDQPQDGPCGQALAAAAFAHDAQHAASMEIEADAIEGARRAGVLDEVNHQVAHGQDVALSINHRGPPRRAGRRPGS